MAEQPIGRDAGLKGARGRAEDPRIQTAMKEATAEGRVAFVVSFENCIAFEPLDGGVMPQDWRDEHRAAFTDDRGRVATDLAAIHVELTAGGQHQTATAWSDGVTLPHRYLTQARRQTTDGAGGTGYDVTAGKLMQADLGVDHANWHTPFTGHSRDEILRRGVESIRLSVV